jgi:hypothetical protein
MIIMKIIRTSVTRNAVLPKKLDILGSGRSEKGDVVLVKLVSSMGMPGNYLRGADGRKHPVRKGVRFLGCISDRYAPKILYAEVPKRLSRGEEINLLERGGTLGIVKSAKPDYVKTRVEFLGFVRSGGKKVNIRNHTIREKDVKGSPELIVVVGVMEDSGKTFTITGLTEGLSKKGYRVCVGKLTGIGNARDVLLSKRKGALRVLSVIDTGWPSSVGLSKKQLDEVFMKIFSNLAEVKPDFIILEIADGLTQRESAILMKSGLLRKRKPRFILSVKDPVGAYGGKILMKREFRTTPIFFTGRGTVTEIARREIEKTTGVKAFDPVTQWKEMTDFMLKKL